MRVFLSCSSGRSKQIATLLREWLPHVLQTVDPWMSDTDIDQGTRWADGLAAQLEASSFGILCLTPESIAAPWILFEAGVLARIVQEAHVCPYLYDLRPSDLTGPLAQFQAAIADEAGTKRIVSTINRALGTNSLSESRLETTFEHWWPVLRAKLGTLKATPLDERRTRTNRELIEEILEISRYTSRSVINIENRRPVMTGAGVELLSEKVGQVFSRSDAVSAVRWPDSEFGYNPRLLYSVEAGPRQGEFIAVDIIEDNYTPGEIRERLERLSQYGSELKIVVTPSREMIPEDAIPSASINVLTLRQVRRFLVKELEVAF
jgi:hypothetical protein